MPFKSEAQRRYLYLKHPAMAKRWEAHTPKSVELPMHVKKPRKKPKHLAKVAFSYSADAGVQEALEQYGLTKEAFFGNLMTGAKNLMGAVTKIPGVGAIAGGALGAVNGYQQGGIKRAIGSGLLGAGTGALGLAGMPLQMAGEATMNGMQGLR